MSEPSGIVGYDLTPYHYYSDMRYRHRCRIEKIPPTEDDWVAYRKALEGLKALEDYEFTEWGGPEYGTDVPEPRERTNVVYLETEDEWLERCRELDRQVWTPGDPSSARFRFDVPKYTPLQDAIRARREAKNE